MENRSNLNSRDEQNVVYCSHNFLLLIIVLVATVSLTSCGGGGGNDKSAPVISNFNYSPTFTLIGSGDGHILVSYDLDFNDNNGNVSTMTLSVYDSIGNMIDTTTGPIDGISGVKSGEVEGGGYADSTTAGKYTFEIYLTDSTGLKSNVLKGNFTIYNANHPVITNFTYTAIPTDDGNGGEIFDISASVDAIDTDGNISTISIAVYDPFHNQLNISTGSAAIAEGIMSGTARNQATFIPSRPATYTIEVTVTDSTNLASNVLSATFDGFDKTIDQTFGNKGAVLFDMDFNEEGRGIAVQPDGKIIVVGYGDNGTGNNVLLLRYNVDGTLDSSFATGGADLYESGSHSAGEAYAVALQPDGKILVTGYSNDFSNYECQNVLLLRYNSDGTLDGTFGNNGATSTNVEIYDYGYAMALQADGKILVAGQTSSATNTYACVLRYNSDGSLDSGFGTNGIVEYNNSNSSTFQGISVQSDGKIIAAGSTNITYAGKILLVQFNSNGTVDSSFGTGGEVRFNGDSASVQATALGVAVQSDGKIVATGYEAFGSAMDGKIITLRCDADGNPDSTFGTNGYVTYKQTNYSTATGHALALQADGKIVVAGSGSSILVLRYNNNGTLDSSFSGDGVGIYYAAYSGSYRGNSVSLCPDGKIVVTGSGAFSDNYSDFSVPVIRLLEQ